VTLFIKREIIEQLLELHDRYLDQAGRCADAGAFEGALVMLGSAIENMLFLTVTMSEHVLRETGSWPEGDPFKWTLGPLIATATKAGWFENHGIPDTDLAAVVEAINKVRVSTIHPAAYVRDGGRPLDEQAFKASVSVASAIDDALTRVVNELPPPPSDQA
jgi:hypothetical protein